MTDTTTNTGRRTGLDRTDMVATALALVESEGPGALTMRRLAAELDVTTDDPLFAGLPEQQRVWMSHGDKVHELPPGFRPIAHTDNSEYAAIADPERRFYGLQFHPESIETQYGHAMLRNFLDSARAANNQINWPAAAA